MRSLKLAVCLLAILCLAQTACALEPIDDPAFVGYEPGVICVKLAQPLPENAIKTAATGRVTTGVTSLDALTAQYSVTQVQTMFPGAKARAQKGRATKLTQWYVLHFDPKTSLDDVLRDFRSDPNVLAAGANDIMKPDGVPNDALSADQWHLSQISDHDIDAPEAWDIETGNDAIVVAIVDEGAHFYHQDLGGANASYAIPEAARGNMWINDAELNGTTGVDDDSNGFVDDWIGWNFAEGNNNPAPTDGASHGTAVAGLVGAITNDGYGVAGVAGGWSNGSQPVTGNGVRIMDLRCGTASGIGSFEAASGFDYAAANGAHIANLSRRVYSSTSWLIDAIDDYIAGGGLVFKAAGNSNTIANDWYDPGTSVVSVAATDQFDQKNGTSNYGPGIDICAPGEGVWTTSLSGPSGDTWGAASGTSFASPIAAGAAALIWSANPGWTSYQVKSRLLSTAENIDAYLQPQYIGQMGSGRVNVYRALIQTVHVPAEAPTIQAGIDLVADNGLVLVAPGTYTGAGNVNIRTGGRTIQVVSELGPAETIIDCGDTARGFIFDGGETRSAEVSGFSIINGNAGSGFGGGIYIDVTVGEGYPIPIIPSSPTIKNCLVSNCTATKGGGIYAAEGCEPLIENCTIVENTAAEGAGVMFQESSSNIDFNKNCFAYNNGEGLRGSEYSSQPLTWSCNVYWQNSGGNVVGISNNGSNNRYADPLFCDVTNDNFRILIYSPCDAHNSLCGEAIGAMPRCETPFANRGDIDLNGTPFEQADIDLFRSWFDDGDAVFTVDPEAQRRAADISSDGFFLSSEDYERGIYAVNYGSTGYGGPVESRPTDTLMVIDTSAVKGKIRQGVELYMSRLGSGTQGITSGMTARLTFSSDVLTPHWDPAFGDGKHVEFERLGPLLGCGENPENCKGDIIVTSETPGEILISWIYPSGTNWWLVMQGRYRFLRIFFDVTNGELTPLFSPLNLTNAGYYDNHFNELGDAVIPTRVNGRLTIQSQPSCPVLYTHDGTGYVRENTLLTECERSNYAESVVDHYLVRSPVSVSDGSVRFQIRELEDEVTTIEDIELLTVDHPAGTRVAVSNTGEITTYARSIHPIRAVDDDGHDCLEEILRADGNLFERDAPGYLVVTFPHDGVGGTGVSLQASLKPRCPIRDTLFPAAVISTPPTPEGARLTGDVQVERLNAYGEWTSLGNVPVRSFDMDDFLAVTPMETASGKEDVFRISWTDGYSTDMISMPARSESPADVQYWMLSESTLEVQGQMAASAPTPASGAPVTLRKGDILSLAFAPASGRPATGTRDYVIRVTGRYEPDSHVYPAYAPKSPRLIRSFPNPFNAATTIEFELTDPGSVSLKVYNMLGQKVRVLADGEFEPGRHSVTWDGRDAHGTTVASGVYLYRFESGNVSQTRKMILLK